MVSKSTNSILALLIIAAAAVALGIAAQQWSGKSKPTNAEPLELKRAILLPKPKSLPITEFTNHLGEQFSSADFKGQWQILFFGFTHCPDICPTTLHTLRQVKEKLVSQGQWGNIQVNMITVDPDRDTPKRLAAYVPFFDSEFVGLTSEVPAITEFARNVGVLFVAHEADQKGNYDVDHSAALILLNPEGQLAGVISPPHKIDELAHDLGKISAGGNRQKSSSASNTIQIRDAWIRSAPPAADALAGYLTVSNTGRTKVSIVGANSPMFEEIMIHTTSIEGGMASMDEVTKLTIAPGSTVQLAPLQTHLMLLDPVKEIKLNDQIPITLELADGTSVQAIFIVTQRNSD